MDEVIAVSTALKLGTAVVAALLCWLLFRILDWLNDDKFAGARRKIVKNPMASAVYFGLRFLAVTLLVGNILR